MNKFLIIIFFSFVYSLNAQEKSPFHISGTWGVGPSIGTIENKGLNKFNMGLGFGTELVAQFGYRWKDKVDFTIGGGVEYYGQEFNNTNFSYSVAYFGVQLRADIAFVFPLNKNKHSDLNIGFGGGFVPTSNEYLEHRDQSYYAFTKSSKGQRYFIAPLVGFHQVINGNHLTLSATFKRHISPDPLYSVELNGPDAEASNTFQGSYFGIHLKYDWMLNKRKKKAKITPVKPIVTLPSQLVNRPTKTDKKIKVSKRFVKIKLWDHSAIDGDTVSVQLNDDIILVAHMLKRKKKVLKVELKEGLNLLTLMAHNEGTSGENTCTVQIKYAGSKENYLFKTNKTRHETMEIICKPQ